MQELRFNIFGTLISVEGSQGAWRAFYLGAEGKRRPAYFIVPVMLLRTSFVSIWPTFITKMRHRETLQQCS